MGSNGKYEIDYDSLRLNVKSQQDLINYIAGLENARDMMISKLEMENLRLRSKMCYGRVHRYGE